MIKKIFSNKKSFREVDLEQGFNVILADKTVGSTEKDSRNGLGKSFLIDIIHFCLGSEAKKNKGVTQDNLKDYIFGMIVCLNGKEYIVNRSVEDNGFIKISGDFSGWPIEPMLILGSNDYKLNLDDWKYILGYFMFGMSLENQANSPTFRSLISYFIRRGTVAFNDPFRFFPRQNKLSLQLCNSYLLGMNWEYAKKLQIIKEKEKSLANLKKAVRQGLLEGYTSSLGELNTEKVRLQEDLNLFESQIKEFKIHPRYKDAQDEADSITKLIHTLLNKINIDEKILNEYKINVISEKDVSVDKVKEIYGSVGVSFSENLLNSLENVEDFHKTIVANRKEYLSNEIQRLIREIQSDREQIETLSNERAVVMKFLNSHGALEEYNSLLDKKSMLSEKIEKIKSAIFNLTSFEQGKSALKIEHEELIGKARLDLEQRKELLEKAIIYFNKNSNFLYSKPGRLMIDLTKAGYNFDVEIERSGSQGIDYMKVFCYDLMLAQLWSGISKNQVLVHDSTIFDGVDERQVAKALELAYLESTRLGFQYICTLNSDDVPLSEFTEEFKYKFKNSVRMTLTDKDESGSLLGVRF